MVLAGEKELYLNEDDFKSFIVWQRYDDDKREFIVYQGRRSVGVKNLKFVCERYSKLTEHFFGSV